MKLVLKIGIYLDSLVKKFIENVGHYPLLSQQPMLKRLNKSMLLVKNMKHANYLTLSQLRNTEKMETIS